MKNKFRKIFASFMAAVMILPILPAKKAQAVYYENDLVYELFLYYGIDLNHLDSLSCPDCGKEGTLDFDVRPGDNCMSSGKYDHIIGRCTNCLKEYSVGENYELFEIPLYTGTGLYDFCGGHEQFYEYITYTDCANFRDYYYNEYGKPYETVYCPICGHETFNRNLDLPVTHHYELVGGHEPTCTEKGYKDYYCFSCNDSYTKTFGVPTGHNYVVDKVVEPTCQSEGYTVYRCSNSHIEYADYYGVDSYDVECGDEYCDNYIYKLPHKYEPYQTVAPTCTQKGYTVYKCVNGCEDSYNADYVPATGHTYVRTVISPTCREQGYTLVKCKDCSYSYKENYVAPTGHTWNPWVIEKAATETAAGLKKHTCISCGAVESEIIPRLAAPEIYRASLDNQGADTPGTIILWYKLNTVENGVYYYTDSNCTRPINGYCITCPTKSGYVFGGYFTGKNGTGTQYVTDDGTCSDNMYKIAESRTLYAYWIPKESAIGDVNNDGAINSVDALFALRHSVGEITLTGEAFTRADVYKDNTINSIDALLILQYSAGQIDRF